MRYKIIISSAATTITRTSKCNEFRCVAVWGVRCMNEPSQLPRVYIIHRISVVLRRTAATHANVRDRISTRDEVAAGGLHKVYNAEFLCWASIRVLACSWHRQYYLMYDYGRVWLSFRKNRFDWQFVIRFVWACLSVSQSLPLSVSNYFV